ncbi:MAG: ABC transporter permease [Rhodospirillaceae bacterium]|nr:ABC transporter permease [Rhodospirillaceae bacterium]
MTTVAEPHGATSAAAPDDAVTQPRVVTPFRRFAEDFAESRVALFGLMLLVGVIIVGVFAPWIAPQNPYDLTDFTERDARLPPGSERLFDAQIFAVSLPGLEAGVPVSIDAAQTVDPANPFVDHLVIDAVLVETADGNEIRLTVETEPPDALDGLDTIQVENLPRGVELTVGEKHAFRNLWTLTRDDLRSFAIALPPGYDRDVGFRLRLTTTATDPSFTYWLGTDAQGRDMLSAMMYGLRTSLGVGVMSGIFALVIGMSLGLTAAYFGGRVETLIMRIVDLQLSFPAILVALMLLAVLGRGVDKVILALIIVQWAYYARTTRSAALVERRKEYMEAAACLALSRWRIIFRHLLPNCLPPVIVVGTVQVAHAIALEATLSFLGIGLPLTKPSLGLLISNGFDYLLAGKYWISVYPGLALLVTIVAINLVGDQLRDVLNPRLQR